MIDKIKLNAAFREMRKQGMIAIQNFSCCRNCAGYKLAERVEKLSVDKRQRIKGVVTYNRQDAENMRDGHDMYLSYGIIQTAKVGNVGLPTTQVGEIAVRCLNNTGLQVKWSADPAQRILVLSKKKDVSDTTK